MNYYNQTKIFFASLLLLAGIGSSQLVEASNCGTTTTSGGALISGESECITANGLYFYLDVARNNSQVTITTTGGSGEADLFVNTGNWATAADNFASSQSPGTEETLTVTAASGRLYISVFGLNEQVTLVATESGGQPGSESHCGADTISDYALTLNQQECISGNGRYFYIDIEQDNIALEITTNGGTGEADIYLNTGNWATVDNHIASSTNPGTTETLIYTAHTGRHYISVFGLNSEVDFRVGTPTIDVCGEDTLAESLLTLNQSECVSGSGNSYYYFYVEKDNTEIAINSSGGSGSVNLFAKTDGWAYENDYHYASTNIGNTETISLIANAGYVYLTLVGDHSGVRLLASSASNPGSGTGNTDDDPYPKDASRFIGLNSHALIERIVITDYHIINSAYGLSGSDATQLFSEANILAITNAVSSRAANYSGVDHEGIRQLIYFMRAAFFVQHYSPQDVPAYSASVKSAITSALNHLFTNNSIWNVSDENAGVLQEALTLIDSASVGASFNHILLKVLNDYNSDWRASSKMNIAANAVFSTIFRAQWDENMTALYASDHRILDALNDFQMRNRALLGTDSEYVLNNAVRELSRLYYIPSMFSKVKPLVKSILNSTNKNDHTKNLWLTAASMADYYDARDCGYYAICGFAFTVEQQTLAFNYQCSDSLKIRGQSLYNAQGEWICSVLGTQEYNFHQILETLNIPVAEDNNDDLELVIFDSKKDYQTYSGIFFGNPTNNGGIYLEGEPNAKNNQARFVAFEADWERPNFHVWNLQHEYVHYLDGRYNLFGNFAHSISANTVWWIEGLAEYIAYRDGNKYAVEVGKTQAYKLSDIFQNNYSSSQDRIYTWGYLAVRFMFERHKTDVRQILKYLRNNQYTEYQTYMNSIGTNFDAEWFNWLSGTISTDDMGIINYGPNDSESAYSGTAGNWAGDPVTISTDFSPCTPQNVTNAYDPNNNLTTLNSFVECIDASSNQATFVLANTTGSNATIEITTSGGWGNAEILYSTTNWPDWDNYDGIAEGNGNYHTLTVQLNPNQYWHYITLKGDFGGVRMDVTQR